MEVKRRNADKNMATVLVEAVKTSMSAGITGGHVIAVVGKMCAGREAGRFTDNFIALHDELRAIAVFNHPLPAEQRNGPGRIVTDRQIINERVGPIRRQLLATVTIDNFVDLNAQAGQFEGGSHRAREVDTSA